MPWVRSGYCCRCGECCKGDPYEGRDDQRTPLMRRAPSVQGYCPLFEWHAEGEGFCVGHIGAVPAGQEDGYYMGGCVHWPDHPDQLKDYPRCTYSFTWVNGSDADAGR